MTKKKIIEVFQLTEEQVDKNKNLSRNDVGKWGFIKDGFYHGFFFSKEKAEQWLLDLKSKLY